VVKIRKRTPMNMLFGPPANRDDGPRMMSLFFSKEGKHIICGGTTASIAAKYLGKRLDTTLNYVSRDVPPISKIEGVDLVTEGVITLRRLLALSEKYVSVKDLTPKTYSKKDGGSLLANIIFEEATHVVFFVGQNVNAAHQGLDIDITMKLKLVERLAANLRTMGKEVTVNYD
jgi:hypothetical protein